MDIQHDSHDSPWYVQAKEVLCMNVYVRMCSYVKNILVFLPQFRLNRPEVHQQ